MAMFKGPLYGAKESHKAKVDATALDKKNRGKITSASEDDTEETPEPEGEDVPKKKKKPETKGPKDFPPLNPTGK
jgi:hypothetical protein